jgi:polyphosphate kinase
MGSADWMTRNLYHRIEVCVALKNAGIRKQLIDYFELQWTDNDKAVELTASLDAVKTENQEHKINAQEAIYGYLKNLQ